jgi:hypothetical protein
VAAAFQRNRDEGHVRARQQPLAVWRRRARLARLQVCSLDLSGSALAANRVIVVVTRQDAPVVHDVNDDLEQYALCVSIADRANVQSRLYAQIQALLRARVEQRARARV